MCIVAVVVVIAIAVNMFRRRRFFLVGCIFYSYQLTFINIGYWDWILGLAD